MNAVSRGGWSRHHQICTAYHACSNATNAKIAKIVHSSQWPSSRMRLAFRPQHGEHRLRLRAHSAPHNEAFRRLLDQHAETVGHSLRGLLGCPAKEWRGHIRVHQVIGEAAGREGAPRPETFGNIAIDADAGGVDDYVESPALQLRRRHRATGPSCIKDAASSAALRSVRLSTTTLRGVFASNG